MSDPFAPLIQIAPGDIITPSAAEIERHLSGAGTYLLSLDDHEIAQLRAGKVVCFYLEDMQNILVCRRASEQDAPDAD